MVNLVKQLRQLGALIMLLPHKIIRVISKEYLKIIWN